MKEGNKYMHIRNGNEYIITNDDLSVKQTSDNEWEHAVEYMDVKTYQVFITGSNAKMLSADISTTLGGRFFNKTINPLSFSEFLVFNKIYLKVNWEYSNQRFDIKEKYEEYLQYGGFPELVRYRDKREYLSNIYQKLFYGDVIARYSVSNPQILRLLIKKLAESVNNETSINRIKNLIKSTDIPVGNSTLFEYIEHLNNSFIISEISNYTSKYVERETKKKYYFSDTGLLSLFLMDQDSKLLENQVYVELKRRYQETIYFYKRNIEVDFYIPERKLLIQVSYNIVEEDARKREIKSLVKVMKEENIDSGIIITYDGEERLEIDNKVINIIPAWKWLLLANQSQ